MRLFVDDIRNPPDDSWLIARSFAAAMAAIRTGSVVELSLDHDLGDVLYSGYDIACALEACCVEHGMTPPKQMVCHSANPPGKANIERCFSAIRKNCVQ